MRSAKIAEKLQMNSQIDQDSYGSIGPTNRTASMSPDAPSDPGFKR
jgi:hypothetical protein